MSSAFEDSKFMKIALRLARKGLGRTSPNPCVGAVVVQNGTVISEGYHKKAGTPHAEIHALRRAGNQALGATLYVTLEPCNHTGRTPPCSHAIVKAGINRVVVGMLDPNPLVNGSGNNYLLSKGVKVTSGVLEDECRELNLPFLKHIATGLPFVVMKAGVSLDGKISYQQGQAGKITGSCSSKKVHGLRNTLDAILVGRRTIEVDDPSLTTRLPGRNGRDPVRVVLDSSLHIPLESKIFQLSSSASTIIFCGPSVNREKKKALQQIENVFVETVAMIPGDGLDLGEVLKVLGKMGICSVLVEGGAAVHGSFVKNRLVDRVILFVAPLFAGSDGTSLLNGFSVEAQSQALRLQDVRYRRCGDDMIVQGNLFQ